MNNKSVNLNILIGLGILAITAIIFVFQVLNTKRKLDDFNNTLGKNESATIAEAVQILIDNKKMGTFDENVKYNNLTSNKDIIEIKEKMFIAQTNDIYLNSGDYLGKNIKLEGLFKTEDFPSRENPYYYVLRYGPGCCGYDGSAGFEVMWDTNTMPIPTYPKEDDWVEAVGILKEDNNENIYIALTSLTVLNIRGAEFVRQ